MPPKFNPRAGSFTPKKMSIDDYLAQQSPQPSTPSSVNSTRPGTPLNGSTTSLTSALEKLATTPITPYLVDIHCAKNIAEVRTQANLLADSVTDARNLIEWDLLSALKALSKPKNPVIIREAALIIISVLTTKFQQPNEAYFVTFLPIVFDAAADKEPSVRREGTHAFSSIYRMFPVEALAPFALPELLKYLKSSAKWVSKISCLKAVDKIIDDSPNDLIEMQFVDAIPVLTDASTDFKPELAKAGKKTLSNFVQVLDNLDLSPRFDIIVDTLGDPKKVPDAIKSFSSVTFVAEVTEPALALLVPILDKSLKLSSSSQEQLRQTVIVTENLTRLVNNKREIEAYIPVLLPGVKRVVETASLPEVRELAAKALSVLEEAEAEHSDGKFHGRVHQEEMAKYIKPAEPIVFKYLCILLCALANVNDWKRMKEYFSLVTDNSEDIVHSLRTLFNPATETADDDGEEEIVNSDFSLAYGSRMLLNKTTLRLLKGHRYGLCGRNGAGKSTLMRSIANGQLEGFPDKSQLRTCFVEHKIQESEADMDLVSFIHGDEDLDATRDEVSEALESVGFDSERRAQKVGSLSGGWKMKLELARAMLMKADVLLLDEPTNHLDVSNVQWLISYLLEHTNITSLIVSHDSGFLDSVCTDVIHYENKKLAYYKGNLSEFVKQKPECKSYYTLSDSVVKMAFPPPGILTGVKSNTRSVAKMTDVTFGYPGAEKPSLSHVTCSLSLSSRVAILGPNGAGKSTLIKLLTGELVPWEGKVEKHPNLRIGYIAQHALAHVEQHKEKTANQYLQWRYRFGEDREVLLKESRKISDEEKHIMEKEIVIDDGRGPRQIEAVVGRQKLKKSFQYEIKWKFWLPKYNSWVSRERLIEEGFEKLVQKFDDHESSREGLGYRDLTPKVISKHFADVGLDSDIADHTPMGSLSGGQLVKVVIAGAMWNNPHLLVLDEPTNYLDRDSLGGLAVAIKEWAGGVVMISHNSEFVSALCPEQWTVENGAMKSNNEAEHDDSPANIKVKTRKKKMTRNDKKLRDERRRLRHINWLSSPKGTPKPVDTSDEE